MMLTSRIEIYWDKKLESTEENLTVNRNFEETFCAEHDFVNT
jgi:hypothetical protein